MPSFPSPFGSGERDELFDDEEAFVPEHIPQPGRFLDGHRLLSGDDHVAFHRTTRDLFEERGVYDMTFGYNLARLNLDTRHPDAGYRYAVDAGDGAILRAEFTPTTPFCPQSDTLTKGSFRAWNGLSARHEYDLVRVRVAEMHHRSDEINRTLDRLADDSLDSGAGTPDTEASRTDGRVGQPSDCGDDSGTSSRAGGPDGPF